MTKEFSISKADPVGDQVIPDVVIRIERVLADMTDPVHAETIYNTQAKIIVDALTRSLPQGTLDRVLGKLLVRKGMTYLRSTAINDEE